MRATQTVVYTPVEGAAELFPPQFVEYLEGWLNGRGAKGIDSLVGRPGGRLALIDVLATARISVAQTAQRVLHRAQAEDSGERHDFPLMKRLLHEELADILRLLRPALSGPAYQAAEVRDRKAVKIAMRWIRNYTELDFRSLGSYTRAQLDGIASEPDAF